MVQGVVLSKCLNLFCLWDDEVGYCEQMEKVLCKFIETAIDCKRVSMLILLRGGDIFSKLGLVLHLKLFVQFHVVMLFKGFCIWFVTAFLKLLLETLISAINRNRTLAQGLECSPMARKTWVQSPVESYQRLKKWYLMLPCLALSIIGYGSRVKQSNPGKEQRPPLHIGVVAIEKGAFGLPSTMVANFY